MKSSVLQVSSPDRTFRHVDEPRQDYWFSLLQRSLICLQNAEVLGAFQKLSGDDYESCIPDVINEDLLRGFEAKFHGKQSQYDTYISDSDIEKADKNLPVIRGHISVIYHLLETATELCHYYERHIAAFFGRSYEPKLPISREKLLDLLFTFCLSFANHFINSAKTLCQNMIKDYAVKGVIEVPIPVYRGFHVRPSTLIAKIVHHYGSEVRMVVNGKNYNASRPLELFRANEEINAQKRTELLDYLAKDTELKGIFELSDLKIALHEVFVDLLKKKKMILYDKNYSFDELKPLEEESAAEYVRRGIAHSLALGWIDLLTEMQVCFEGDERVLTDIRILADSGYGEDKYGNNIPLPAELSYLKY